MNEVTIEVEKRERTGKGGSRQSRRAGFVPGVVYGGDRESLSIQVVRRTLTELFRKGASDNQIFLLKLAGTDKTRHAMIRDMDVDPISHEIRHVDFLRIAMNRKIKVQVPVALQGLAYGVKNQGAVLDFVTRQISVECLPGDIPASIDLDVTPLQLHQHVEARELTLPKGVTLAEDPDRVVVAVSASKTEKAAEVVGAPAEAAAEPEVVKKGKGEEEGGEKAEKEKEKDKEKDKDKKK